MAELAGDARAATPVQIAQADAPTHNLNDYVNEVNGLRGTGNHGRINRFNPDALKFPTAAGDAKPVDTKPIDAKSGDAKPGDAKAGGLPAGAAGDKGKDSGAGKLPQVEISGEKPGGPASKVVDSLTATDTESKWSKIGRETLIMGGGLGRSVLYGMANLPNRVPELGASVAIGSTLSSIARSGEFGAAATIFVGAYFTSRYIVNAVNDTARWQKFSDATVDAWHSDKNFWKDMKDVSDSGGNFAFDTALSYGAGYVGYKKPELAEIILGGLKLPVPVPSVPGIPPKLPFPPRIMSAGMYLSIAPAPILYRQHHMDEDREKERFKTDDKH